jgi:hypothetical protein
MEHWNDGIVDTKSAGKNILYEVIQSTIPLIHYSNIPGGAKHSSFLSFVEPTPNLNSPFYYPFIMVGITSFKIFQKTPYQFASGGKDGQADHDEEDSLENREE